MNEFRYPPEPGINLYSVVDNPHMGHQTFTATDVSTGVGFGRDVVGYGSLLRHFPLINYAAEIVTAAGLSRTAAFFAPGHFCECSITRPALE